MSSRIYRLLVRLYPRAFRERYGASLVEAFDNRRRARSMSRFRFWAFHLQDLSRSLAREHVEALRRARRNRDTINLREWTMRVLFQDLKYALRGLRHAPGFAAVVIVTLGLGIGLNTAIFSVINGVLLRPLPYQDAERLIWGFSTFSGGDNASVSPPDFLDYRNQSTSFAHLAARRGPQGYALTGLGAPEQVRGQTVTAGFFEALGGAPVTGRSFSTSDESLATNQVVVLSYGFWQRAFGGAADVLDQTVTLDGTTYDVVGVMPPGFRLFSDVDFWNPLAFDRESNQIRRFHNLRIVGKLESDVAIDAAQAELDLISRQLEQEYPESNATWRLVITPLREVLVGSVRPALLVMLGAVTLVLLIACGNVANLLFARGATRRVEMGVRAALGASRSRVVQQLIAENLTISMLGGGAGLVLAISGLAVLRRLGPQNLPRLDEVGVDWVVLVFALGVSVVSSLVFGILPALTTSRFDISRSLAEGTRSSSRGLGGGRMRAALVSLEVALALVLLVGSGLLVRSFSRLTSVEPGFEPANLLTAVVALRSARYDNPESRSQFFEEAQRRLEGVAGVEQVAYVNMFPMGGSRNDTYLAVPGRHQLGTDTQFNAQTRAASDEYFDVMGIPLLRGRYFDEGDHAESPNVVIIDEPFARSIFPDEDPIGQRLQIDFGDVYEAEIVGVVGGVTHFSLATAPSLTFYLPSRQDMPTSNVLVVRTGVEPEGVMSSVRQVVTDIDPMQPVASMTVATDFLDRSVAQPRFQTLLLGLFATVAVTLSAIGIYGVLAYYVAQRRREVGLRVALGARNVDVYRLVLGRALAYTSVGLAIGLVGAFATTRFMANLLFGVSATDPVTVVVVALLLTVVAAVASYLPARRALRIEPMEAWRQ